MPQIDTGNGATIAVTGVTPGKVISIGPFSETVSRIQIDHLGTTGYTPYMPGDTVDHDEIEAEMYWGSGTLLQPDYGGTLASARTVTITFPSNGTLSGTGFVTKRRGPELRNNQPQIGMFAVSFDGNSGPTYSA